MIKIISSRVLRNNMIAKGKAVPKYANAARHIVAGGAKRAAESREILLKYGIKINDAVNGVFLPTVKGVSPALRHTDLHTNKYYDIVNNLLRDAKSKEDVEEILKMIGTSLENGTFFNLFSN